MATANPSLSRALASTPVKSTPAKPVALVDSPGTWRHPRLNEIARRQEEATFNEKNVKSIATALGTLAVMFVAQFFFRILIGSQVVSPSVREYVAWAWFLVKLYPLAAIVGALKPFYLTKDNLSDIPLTAEQRRLLSLPPSPAPATPGGIGTPPRYSRTPSISGSVGSRASFASSPLSGRGSPIVGGQLGGSPYSAAGSPLAQKSFASGSNGVRKLSVGSPSGMGASTATSLFPDPTSPSPSAGKRTSVALNSKWLYEKGRRSSGGSWLH